jgi:hypothetical protein
VGGSTVLLRVELKVDKVRKSTQCVCQGMDARVSRDLSFLRSQKIILMLLKNLDVLTGKSTKDELASLPSCANEFPAPAGFVTS